MTNAEIGDRIKYARDLRGVTLDNIAKKVVVAKSTIQRYETGKINTIKIPVVESIAIALNVNPAWIVGKSEDMELPSQKVPKIMQYYEILNDMGKREATKRVEELTNLSKYIENTPVVKSDEEISNEFFTEPNEARKYLEKHKVAAFSGGKNLSDEAIIQMANIALNKSDKHPEGE